MTQTLHRAQRRHLHLDACLDYVWTLLTRRVRAMQVQGTAPLPDDPYPGVLISPLFVDARLVARRGAPVDASAPTGSEPPSAEEPADKRARVVAQALSEANAQLNAALTALQGLERQRRERDDFPLLAIREAFALDDLEWIALLIALANEIDPDVAPTLAYAQRHFDRRTPSAALIADVVGDDIARGAARRRFEPDAPLIRHGLIQLDPPRPGDATLHRGYRVDPRLLLFMDTPGEMAPALIETTSILDPGQHLDDLAFGSAELPAWDRFRAFATRPHASLAWSPVAVMVGPPGAGRQRWIIELARRFDTRVLAVDLAQLGAGGKPVSLDAVLRAASREALLLNAVLCLRHWGALFDVDKLAAGEEGGSPDLRRRRQMERLETTIRQLARTHRGLICVTMEPADPEFPTVQRGVERFDVPMPSEETRKALWTRHLPPAIRRPTVDLALLARRFPVTPGRMVAAIRAAQRDAATRGMRRLTMQDIAMGVRNQIEARMGSSARLKATTERWEDMVLPPEVAIQLRELCNRYLHRATVMDGWGLARRFASGRGLSALFEGPPGTGKTMAAGVIAHELGLDLYQVDLSQIVSKWIGETEKNLSRIFDEAERSGAMILFDEADSLFSKRTSVSSSNDRYANLEVNYLLQRVERFTGIAILTTNFSDSIDKAFSRRLSMRVTFLAPSVAERTRLWQTMLDQPDLPVGDFDAAALAEEFELTGGLIGNAVLRAAFLAASRDMEVKQSLLELSARVEMKEQGMLIRGNPHSELTDLPPSGR